MARTFTHQVVYVIDNQTSRHSLHENADQAQAAAKLANSRGKDLKLTGEYAFEQLTEQISQ